VIAHSQIVVAQPRPMPTLPAGFDDSDIAVLDWIAAEGPGVSAAASYELRPGSSVHVSVGPCDAIELIKSLTAARRPASPSDEPVALPAHWLTAPEVEEEQKKDDQPRTLLPRGGFAASSRLVPAAPKAAHRFRRDDGGDA
jgi:hypothetical protein